MLKSSEGVVEAEQLDKFALIGHSLGGYVTLAMAKMEPGRFPGFGLFHSTAYPDNEVKIANRKRGIAFIQTHGPLEFLKQAIPNLFSEGYKKEQPAEVQKLIDRATNFSALTLVQYYEAMMVRPNRTGLLKSLELPILFIIGEEDKTLNLQDGLTQACMPALSHVFLFPRAAHMGMWESTHRSNTSLMKFLDQQKEP
jgi:pimeloyl-ACP methyl ester carboxylesterase